MVRPTLTLHTILPSNISRGFTLSYGAFQAYYKSDLLSSASPSAISWIGTVQGWLLIFFGVLSGPLFDLGYFRVMLIVGNFLVVFGIMMLSLSTKYWQVFLSQGMCMGLGAGLLYIPSLALVGIWFDKKRAIALGIVMSGIAVGRIKILKLKWVLLIWARWCHLHIDVRSPAKVVWLPVGHARHWLCRARRSSTLCSCPPQWIQRSGYKTKGSITVRQDGVQGQTLPHLYMLLVFNLSRLYRTLLLHTDVCQG